MEEITIHPICMWDTKFCADSVEWCPFESLHKIFVCGTYQLVQGQEGSQKKIGKLYLMSLPMQCDESDMLKVQLLQTIEMSAILDTKWCPQTVTGNILLAVANSDGEVLVYQLLNNQLTLKCNNTVSSSSLALSLDWRISEDKSLLCVSDSAGKISLLEFHDSNLRLLSTWKAHDFEAWIVAFDYWRENIIYSGGDDNKFLMFDTRLDNQKPLFVNKQHNMGVTSIHSNPCRENILATGSYDEQLRIWDTRNLKQPISEISLDGGVWRLKWDNYSNGSNILAACMHAGFKTIHFDNQLHVTGELTKHESLAYGADWSFLNSDEIMQMRPHITKSSRFISVIGTCSFYDHKLIISVLESKSS